MATQITAWLAKIQNMFSVVLNTVFMGELYTRSKLNDDLTRMVAHTWYCLRQKHTNSYDVSWQHSSANKFRCTLFSCAVNSLMIADVECVKLIFFTFSKWNITIESSVLLISSRFHWNQTLRTIPPKVLLIHDSKYLEFFVKISQFDQVVSNEMVMAPSDSASITQSFVW